MDNIMNADEKTELGSSTPVNAWESNKQEISSKDQFPDVNVDISLDNKVEEIEETRKPSLSRLCLRVWQLLAGIGAFGFQVGATPYSSVPIPFESLSLFYYGYTICWISIIWSSFNVFVYLTRRYGKGKKVKRVILSLTDVAMTALFGVCVFYEITLYKCRPGQYDGWCDFHNTGIFFLMSLFFTYIIHALWDIFGAMTCLRR